MLWAGEVGVLETNLLAGSVECDPAKSQCIPVFRTYALEETCDRITAAGGRIDCTESNARGTTRFFADPHGYPFGVELVDEASVIELDARLLAQWAAGPASLPGGLKIEGPIQTLSRVIHLTSDPNGDASFLAEVLGLRRQPSIAGNVVLSLGSTTLLEIRGSAVVLERPGDRTAVPDSWIVREYSHDTLRKAARDLGEDPVESLQFKGGALDYFCTPSNRLFGFQERRPYDPDEPMTQMVEDLFARSLWLDSH